MWLNGFPVQPGLLVCQASGAAEPLVLPSEGRSDTWNFTGIYHRCITDTSRRHRSPPVISYRDSLDSTLHFNSE